MIIFVNYNNNIYVDKNDHNKQNVRKVVKMSQNSMISNSFKLKIQILFCVLLWNNSCFESIYDISNFNVLDNLKCMLQIQCQINIKDGNAWLDTIE